MKSVLFVCIENACRSQLAEAICNNNDELDLVAYSAGSNPGLEINPKAIASLQRIGIDHRGEPKGLSFYQDKTFGFVVGMGCGDKCPYIPGAKIIEWDIPDPKLMNQEDFDSVRDLIKLKISSDLI